MRGECDSFRQTAIRAAALSGHHMRPVAWLSVADDCAKLADLRTRASVFPRRNADREFIEANLRIARVQSGRDFPVDGFPHGTETPRPFAMRHTISVLVENKFGVLTRIAGMFSGRGFNIDTLNVGPTLDPSTSRMTIVVRGDDTVLEQVTKQLNKLVDVIEIEDFSDDEVVERELVLLRVKVDAPGRGEVMQMCDIFRAKIIDVQHNNLAIEITGNESKIDKFLLLMGKFGVTELNRTGRVALARRPQ